MKDFTKEQLEASRPNIPADQAVQFCLDQLYVDKTKNTNDVVAGVCTYEELIGALLLARDAVEDLKARQDEDDAEADDEDEEDDQ